MVAEGTVEPVSYTTPPSPSLLMEVGAGVVDDGNTSPPVVATIVLASSSSSSSVSRDAGTEVGNASGLTGAEDMGSADEAAAAVVGMSSSCPSWVGLPLEGAGEGAGTDEAACAGAAAEDDTAFPAAAMAGTSRVTPALLHRLWAKERTAGGKACQRAVFITGFEKGE